VRTHIATTSAIETGELQAWMFLPEIREGILKDTGRVEGIKECQVAGRAIGEYGNEKQVEIY
jgi:hypothetical protein